jgi:hypothetical protein
MSARKLETELFLAGLEPAKCSPTLPRMNRRPSLRRPIDAAITPPCITAAAHYPPCLARIEELAGCAEAARHERNGGVGGGELSAAS